MNSYNKFLSGRISTRFKKVIAQNKKAIEPSDYELILNSIDSVKMSYMEGLLEYKEAEEIFKARLISILEKKIGNKEYIKMIQKLNIGEKKMSKLLNKVKLYYFGEYNGRPKSKVRRIMLIILDTFDIEEESQYYKGLCLIEIVDAFYKSLVSRILGTVKSNWIRRKTLKDLFEYYNDLRASVLENYGNNAYILKD